MDTPKDDAKLNAGKDAIKQNIDTDSEGILDSIKDKKDDFVESISEKNEKIVSSIKETKDDIKESIQEKKEDLSKSINSGVKKTKSFLKKLIFGLLFLGVLSFGFYMLYANWTYSEGTRAGNLIKISKKGYVFKTYEGQLKLGGIDLQNQNDGLSDTWNFSVTDETVIAKLEKMQGQKVVLRYKQINKAMPWQGDTDYFICDVE